MPDVAFDAAVLCGGASRRMGRDKATLEIDGTPMFQRVLDAATAAGAVTTTAIGGAATIAESVDHVADRWPGEGPLGGVITALGAAGDRPVAVLSCDLVTPDAATIAELVSQRSAHGVDAVVAVVDGVDQWTVAVWHRRVIDTLVARFVDGERAIRRAVGDLHVLRVDVPAVAVADADTPEDLP